MADEYFFLPPLSTEVDGLTIRSWQVGDGATLARVANSSYEHLRPWMDWAVPDDTPEAAEARVRSFAGSYLRNEDFIMSVWDGQDLVGGSGFHLRWGPLSTKTAEIGMWIAGDRAHRGLGTIVLKALVEWGFSDDWGWQRLVWQCDPMNHASVAVANKVGFRLEGTLREAAGSSIGRAETQIWGLLASDVTEVANG